MLLLRYNAVGLCLLRLPCMFSFASSCCGDDPGSLSILKRGLADTKLFTNGSY
jgi:hypothetical protein